MTQTEILNKIESEMSDQMRAGIVQSLMQFEQRMVQTQNKAMYREIAAEVAKIYETLDSILAKIVVMLKFPRKMREWQSTEPLDTMVKTFPEIRETKWYQMKMEYILAS